MVGDPSLTIPQAQSMQTTKFIGREVSGSLATSIKEVEF